MKKIRGTIQFSSKDFAKNIKQTLLGPKLDKKHIGNYGNYLDDLKNFISKKTKIKKVPKKETHKKSSKRHKKSSKRKKIRDDGVTTPLDVASTKLTLRAMDNLAMMSGGKKSRRKRRKSKKRKTRKRKKRTRRRNRKKR